MSTHSRTPAPPAQVESPAAPARNTSPETAHTTSCACQASSWTLTTTDGPLSVHQWEPRGLDPRGVLHIVHGTAEHALRYERFARHAASRGWIVVAEDHHGHGASWRPGMTRGDLGERGWDGIVDDVVLLASQLRRSYPELPQVLLGHSWGSLLARDAATRAQVCDALILMGTAAHPGLAGVAGRLLTGALTRLRGHAHVSGLIDRLAFGALRSSVPNARTEADWLSRDPAEVEAFLSSPDSGYTPPVGFYDELIRGSIRVNRGAHARRIPRDLPLLLISGSEDPVGAQGSGVLRVAQLLRRQGHGDLTVLLYPGARHEVLNELNRHDVEDDLLWWMTSRSSRARNTPPAP